jgi:hypothetical protein
MPEPPALARLEIMSDRRYEESTVRERELLMGEADEVMPVSVRNTGALSTDLLETLKHLEKTLLALALVGLGAAVNIKKLRLLGSRPIILGFCSWLLVLATSVITIRLIPLNL